MTETNQPAKKEIHFVEILKRAAEIVWRNRFLLWFGVLVALGSPGSFNVGNSEDWNRNGGEEAVKNFMTSHWQLVLAVAIILFAVGVVLFLLSLVGKAGLVKSVNIISQGRTTNFREGWKFGKKCLWKLFRLFLLFFITVFVVFLVLGIPVVYLIATQSWVSAILVGILAIAIFIPLIFVLSLTNAFAEFYIILSDLKVWSAVEAGYNLLLKNIVNSLVFGLLLMVVGMAAMFVFLMIVGLALVILIPAGMLFYGLGKIIFGFFLAIAILLFLMIIFFASSIFQTYRITAWTLFFQEIAKVEKEELASEAEKAESEEIVATPEKA